MAALANFIVLISFLVFISYRLHKLSEEEEVLKEEDKAFEDLYTWKIKHPDMYIADNLQAKILLRRRIEAYRKVRKICTFLTTDENHLLYLESLFHKRESYKIQKRQTRKVKRKIRTVTITA